MTAAELAAHHDRHIAHAWVPCLGDVEITADEVSE